MKKTTRELNSFFLHVLSVALMSVVIAGILFLNVSSDPDSYIAESIQQVDLLKKIKGPRIIVFGGSNVAFGIDAALMQKELGIPVINDGLHAGLGVPPLRELQQYIHQGDVIIISLQYAFFTREETLYGHPDILADWTEYDPYRVKYLSYSPGDMLQHYHVMLQRKINRTLDTYLHAGSLNESRDIYLAQNFDVNGDFIGHLYRDPVSPERISSDAYPVTNLLEDAFVFLNEFKQAIYDNEATIYFEAPASRETNCLATGKDNLIKFYKSFEEKTSIPILTDLGNLCMPDKYFFDTEYHLNAKGREIRTIRLVENLLKANETLNTQQP